MINTNQYYPTPRSLAFKAFSKFKNLTIARLLEPSAGRGTSIDYLIEYLEEAEQKLLREKGFNPHRYSSYRSSANFEVDVLEIDQEHLPHLKEKKLNIVGYDFLSFNGSPIYSHIFLNPPFNAGAKHLIHAWNLLYTGEVVAILNAETLRNPYSAERQLLSNIISDNGGTVEYVTGAFQSPDTEIKAQVEVAIIHLQKKQDIKTNYIDGLKIEVESNYNLDGIALNEVAVQGDHLQTFKNMVIAFECATAAAKEFVLAGIKHDHYKAMLRNNKLYSESRMSQDPDANYQLQYSEIYHELKNTAWHNVLYSTDVLSRQSSKGQERLMSGLKDIAKLEFTLDNILGFIGGMINDTPKIQVDMCCDVFDRISAYHSDNRIYYRGWKSNSKHRSMAFKIKPTRFILPIDTCWNGGLRHSSEQMLADFDKVFCLLDGKHYDATEHDLTANTKMQAGERLKSRYFDLRFYPSAGTLHFYTNRPDLIERLNRIVGKYRNWLPADDSQATPNFKKQYDLAEKTTKIMRNKTASKTKGWGSPSERHLESKSSNSCIEANELFGSALDEAQVECGIKQDWLLTSAADKNTATPSKVIGDELKASGSAPSSIMDSEPKAQQETLTLRLLA